MHQSLWSNRDIAQTIHDLVWPKPARGLGRKWLSGPKASMCSPICVMYVCGNVPYRSNVLFASLFPQQVMDRFPDEVIAGRKNIKTAMW
jgi:hypothetical protein